MENFALTLNLMVKNRKFLLKKLENLETMNTGRESLLFIPALVVLWHSVAQLCPTLV